MSFIGSKKILGIVAGVGDNALLNIENGKGNGSIQQKEYTDHEGNKHPNTVTGEGAAAFGKGHNVSGINSFTAGQLNTNAASGALVAGNDVNNGENGYYAILVGHHISNVYPRVAMFGRQLISQNEGETVIGKFNNPAIIIPLHGGYVDIDGDNRSLLKIGDGVKDNRENAYEFTSHYFASRKPISVPILYTDKILVDGEYISIDGDKGNITAKQTITSEFLKVNESADIKQAFISNLEIADAGNLANAIRIYDGEIIRKVGSGENGILYCLSFPERSGTIATIEDVDDAVAYAVKSSGGKLYEHNIIIQVGDVDNDYYEAYFKITNSTSTKFTGSTIVEYLLKVSDNSSHAMSVTGIGRINSVTTTSVYAMYVAGDASDFAFAIYYLNNGDPDVYYFQGDYQCVDKVIEI